MYQPICAASGVWRPPRGAAQIWAIFRPGGDALGGRLPRRGLRFVSGRARTVVAATVGPAGSR
jgi:hypothetical protein